MSVSVLQAGLACCGVESSSVDLVSNAWNQTESASKLAVAQHILVIAGTVTHALAPTVKSAYDALQEPKVVVAFGACRHMPAKRFGPAGFNRRHYFELAQADMPRIGLPPRRTVSSKDVSDLQLGPGHPAPGHSRLRFTVWSCNLASIS